MAKQNLSLKTLTLVKFCSDRRKVDRLVELPFGFDKNVKYVVLGKGCTYGLGGTKIFSMKKYLNKVFCTKPYLAPFWAYVTFLQF